MSWAMGKVVVHGAKPEWGVGKVVSSNSQELAVFFVGGGRRVFGQPATFLLPAPADEAGNPLLDNLARGTLEGNVRYFSLTECVGRFHKLFPDGFYDATYLSEDPKVSERRYKVAASELAKSLLNEEAWSELANRGDFAEVCRRLAKVESKTNLLHSFEKIKWHAALKDEALQPQLSNALFRDLYGARSREVRFTELARVLGQAEGCAKWTIATYYGYLLQPEARIFIKPEVTKFSAEACGWDLMYDSALNWTTLSQAEGLAKYLLEYLTRMGLRPRDMIDVQSFIWCIAPGSYA